MKIKNSRADPSKNNNLIIIMLYILLTVTILSTNCGCSICFPSRNGTTHHLIIGIGIVSVNKSPNNAVVITDTNAFGMTVMDRPGLKFGLGYTSSLVMTVPDNVVDVRAEIKKNIFAPTVIYIHSAILANYTSQWRVRQ